MKLRQRPHKSPVEVKFKFSDKHSLPFQMGAPPGFPNVKREVKEGVKE